MIRDLDLICKWCGTDLKFTAPIKKNSDWFCSRVCEISTSVNELNSMKVKCNQISKLKNTLPNLGFNEFIAHIFEVDRF
tara:strand:+ start:1009 stop:1245 length:237 start_codon:yes stop_codon:yes gene_type:complete